MLSLLLWAPFTAGLVVLLAPERSLTRPIAKLAAAAPFGLLFATSSPQSMTTAWLPHLGASYDVALSGFWAALVAVVAAVALASVAGESFGARLDRRVAATLVAETAVLGTIASRDALLLLCFAGAACVSLAVSLGDRRFAVGQWLGLSIVMAAFVFAYHAAWSQSGFPATSLGRFHGLVLFPEQQSPGFLLAATGPLIMMLGVRPLPKPAPLFFAAYPLVPGFLLVQLVVSVFPDGASMHASWGRAVGLGLVFLACFAPRARLGWALQGLFLIGLFSLEPDGVVAAGLEWAHLVLALAVWSLWGDAPRRWIAASSLGFVLLPPGLILFGRALPGGFLFVLAALWMILGRRLWKARRVEPIPVELPFRPSHLPLAALCVALYLGPLLFRASLESSLETVPFSDSNAADEATDEDEDADLDEGALR